MDNLQNAMHRRSWSDLSTQQRAQIIIVGIAQLALLGAALWDIWHRPPDRIRGPRGAWTAASFVNWIGPLAYFIFGRKR